MPSSVGHMNDYPPPLLHVSASETVCTATIAGWLWYCDEHDTHGNADSEDEARRMADAHGDYFLDLARGDDPDPCEIIVWMRAEHERADH